MKKYRVGVLEEIGGYITIGAKTEASAKAKALEMVNEFGIDGLYDSQEQHKYTVDITHRGQQLDS